MGRNAMEIMSFTTDMCTQYWRLVDERVDHAKLDAYRKTAMSGDYDWLISQSAELILDTLGVKLDCSYLLRERERGMDLHDDD